MNETTVSSPYLTLAEAAAYTKMPERRLERMAKDGKIDKIKVWGSMTFSVEALDRFMSDRTVRAKQ
jgi:excisionase family DNA binding protein